MKVSNNSLKARNNCGMKIKNNNQKRRATTEDKKQ
jgi:hypothetical protein